jgi:hypothetical protein
VKIVPNFAYHGLNTYSYLLAKYGTTLIDSEDFNNNNNINNNNNNNNINNNNNNKKNNDNNYYMNNNNNNNNNINKNNDKNNENNNENDKDTFEVVEIKKNVKATFDFVTIQLYEGFLK